MPLALTEARPYYELTTLDTVGGAVLICTSLRVPLMSSLRVGMLSHSSWNPPWLAQSFPSKMYTE